MNYSILLKKYALLAIKMGVNIQKDDILVINSPIECAEFARLLAESAYDVGAKEVVVHYSDQQLQKINYLNRDISDLKDIPDWQRDSILYYSDRNAAFLSISASDPDCYKDIPVEKISSYQKARRNVLKSFNNKISSDKLRWNVISIPTASWAKKVFPSLKPKDAIDKLWSEIFKTVRITENNDVIKDWEEHNKNIDNKLNILNNLNLKSLHFKNSIGTDLIIDLPNDHIWCGGADLCEDGVRFNANIPTEETFTSPLKTGVNGKVVSSYPLNYGGNIINNFSLTFKDGKVIDYSAEEGSTLLKSLLDSDEGSCYLGEVALVPYNSPISQSGIVFFNTLFDENASCHLALGSCYNSCIKGGTSLTEAEIKERGLNTSIVHEDFMIGTRDLSIIGYKEDNSSVSIFLDGNWCI